MKTLLFGANGYVGVSLQADVRIGRTDGDLLSYQSVFELIAHHKPTHIISAASKHASFKEMQQNHRSFLRENLLIDSNILEAAANCDIENVIVLSSISGLPESELESDEKMLSNGAVPESNFGYNFSKFSSTQLVKSYQLDGYNNFRSLLLGNIYGYNERFSKNTNVVATLIKNMHRAKTSGVNLELYGNGLDTRCLTHLNDVSAIIELFLVNAPLDNNPVIISSSDAHTIKEIANAIASSMKFQNQIVFQGKPEDGHTVKKVNNSRMIDLIGPFEFLDLENGIDRTVNEFLANDTIFS